MLIKKLVKNFYFAYRKSPLLPLITLLVFTILFLSTLLVATRLAVGKVSDTTGKVLEGMREIKTSSEEERQFLLSNISYNEERQRLILFLRDEIMAHWKMMRYSQGTAEKAFKIAITNVKMSEKYPSVSAYTLSALQFVESSWGIYRLSPMGAIGLNQIMPKTGESFARMLGVSFHVSQLDDDVYSTEIAAKYLDMMYGLYGNWGQALADYNGGPYNAWYYKNNKAKLWEETRNYIPKVLGKEKELRQKAKTYRASIKNLDPTGE